MLPRLLYAAVALCLLGTRPDRAAMRTAPSIEVAAPAAEAPAISPRASGGRGFRGVPADFAIPRIQR